MWRWLPILLLISLCWGCSNGGSGIPDSGMDADGYVEWETPPDIDCECTGSEDCPQGHHCDNCHCVVNVGCNHEGQCLPGWQCYDRTCWPLAECDSSGDCPQYRFCNTFSSYCVRDKLCFVDLQCRFGTLCVGNQCLYMPLCDSDSDCLPGNRCVRHNCRPVPDCKDDAECLASERCEMGSCQPVSCTGDSDCRHDWRCYAGACLPRFACDDDADCPYGLPCHNRVCEDTEGCSVPADCAASEVCFWGACVALPTDGCQHDADCADGQVCDFGGCVDQPACRVDDDCQEDQRCLAGACKHYMRCNPIADITGCPRGYRCQNGMCVFGAQCESDPDCAASFGCRDQLCSFFGACELDQDCPFGFSCQAGTCYDSKWCLVDDDCADDEACTLNRCGPDKGCASDQDCSPGSHCSLVTGECRLVPSCPGPDACQAEPDGPGPYPVGVITRIFQDTERTRELVTEIWYPAGEEAREMPTEIVDMGPGLWTIDSGAHRDAPVRSGIGTFPLIVYSHGGRGIRTQFVSYAVRMASHGYLVMSPDHPGDTFLDPSETDPVQLTTDRVADVGFMILMADELNEEVDGPLEGLIDTVHIGASGLCHGGVTVLLAAYYIDRLAAVSPHAPSGVQLAGQEHFEQVTIPVMLFGSELDPDPTPEDLLRAFGYLGGTTYMAEFLRAGHVHLSDICSWDPFNLEACGPHFTPQRVSQELAMFYNLAFYNRYLRDDSSMEPYLAVEYSARIPEILYWPAQ